MSLKFEKELNLQTTKNYKKIDFTKPQGRRNFHDEKFRKMINDSHEHLSTKIDDDEYFCEILVEHNCNQGEHLLLLSNKGNVYEYRKDFIVNSYSRNEHFRKTICTNYDFQLPDYLLDILCSFRFEDKDLFVYSGPHGWSCNMDKYKKTFSKETICKIVDNYYLIRNKDLEERNVQLENEIKDFEDKKKEIEEKIDSLTYEFNNMKDQKDILEKDHEKIAEKIFNKGNIKQFIDNYCSIEILESMNNRLEKENIELKETNRKNLILEKENVELKKRNNRLQKENEILQEKNYEYEKENVELKEKNINNLMLDEKNNTLEKENVELKKKNKELENINYKYNSSKRDFHNLNTKYNKLETELKDIKDLYILCMKEKSKLEEEQNKYKTLKTHLKKLL